MPLVSCWPLRMHAKKRCDGSWDGKAQTPSETPVTTAQRVLLGVPVEPLDEPHHVNDHSLVGAGADGRDTIGRFDLELDAATIDLGHPRLREDSPADRRCRQMLHVDACSHRAL